MPELSERSLVGQNGEEFAARWLINQGYKVLARNYRCRGGEIDIVAKKGEVISFVEVKRRRRNYFALSEVITKSKQQKITYTAQRFISEQAISLSAYRFDVALVEGIDGEEQITYIEQAFRDERFSL